MRKSNQVFSDPANGGILNLNQIQYKPSSSSLDVQSLLLPNSLCCGKIKDDLKFQTIPFQIPATNPPAAPSPGGGFQIAHLQEDKKFFWFGIVLWLYL